MKIVKVWCEWDMGFSNINDNYTVFENMEKTIECLKNINWEEVDYNSWEEVEKDGLLEIEEIEI